MTSPWQQPDVPRYGEYAPTGQTPPPEQVPQGPYYVTPPVKRNAKVGDIVVTVILLVFALIGTLLAVLEVVELPHSMPSAYAQYGVAYSAPADLGVLSWVIIVSHIVLFLAAVGISIPLLVKHRLAFWVPLMFGIVAAVLF